MSLKKNIVANYLSQFYATGIGIAVLPFYIRHLGPEAYGLVGFFTTLQSLFGLLDLGLTPTIARETARFHGGALDARTYRKLVRALSAVFMLIAGLGAIAIVGLSDFIAERWLTFHVLTKSDVIRTVQIMGLCVAIRWMCGLYRGVVTGGEQLVWLGGFNSFIATLRFVAVFATMYIFGFTSNVFFLHQLAVALIELAGLALKCKASLPKAEPGRLSSSFIVVRPMLKFALTIAFTSSVWIAVTQSDRLILSGILNLSEYGYFSLAVMVAGGISLITGPVGTAMMPRMARLHAEGKHEEMMTTYRTLTQLVVAIAIATSVTLVVCAKPALYAWTGNQILTEHAYRIVRLYAIGNAILSAGQLPFILQYAKGNLRYHLVGNIVVAVFLLPSIVIASRMYGGVGAGWIWVSVNALYLAIWATVTHRKIVPGFHGKWILKDVIAVAMPGVFAGLIFFLFEPLFESRLLGLAYTACVGVVISLVTLLSMRVPRKLLLDRLGRQTSS
ncbi:oligosaccharide flippase family protein [Pandoraea apista]|uniref:Polysaccharide biosynthesis protein n=1 Tax=Pandoraea apista TaxID=93218 RepID=A0A5E5NYJ6_9BURK|nr:oligosaccharide flippase family protein [Pandoraea apista]AJE98123.1 polysaccharide biosynthesis protein [Pandoraea apista]AKH72135.1 polysaccharide biosynthesis protein [Pandoraea apista]AKI60566.1 polysaccharide biosynthesis protein [Pandoraea apista]AVF38706.1 polysaccharide biosynthesis protein [Pandoraea apista]OXS94804.1 polysaccharide biosynthesis protein [Pandoraea apista]